MDLGLKGKVALVTAASSGLGLATARELLAEGAQVMICGRSRERLDAAVATMEGEFGKDVPLRTMVADVTQQRDVVALVEETVAAFERLDILITNAGGPPGGTFEGTDLEAWRQGIELTLMSAVYLARTALPYLKDSQFASVLTITSISVKQPINNLMLSNVIRPAVVGMTKVLSLELAGAGVRANSILPGWTRTERVEYLLNHRAQTNGTTTAEEAAKITAGIPMGRMAEPEEFGRVAAFLVSPAASYVNGVMMQVDGGSYPGLL